ncbi:MAG: hypothetical protein G8D28_00940 [gamma proteobacterium symbiont of Phacoides pectinatus]
MEERRLLSIVELGGYPDFAPLYRALGYVPVKVHSMRKAQAWLKRNQPAVVVAEFHFDPELRDRMGNIESLSAALQRYAPGARVILFIEPGHRGRLEPVRKRCSIFGALDYPVDEQALRGLLEQAAGE